MGKIRAVRDGKKWTNSSVNLPQMAPLTPLPKAFSTTDPRDNLPNAKFKKYVSPLGIAKKSQMPTKNPNETSEAAATSKSSPKTPPIDSHVPTDVASIALPAGKTNLFSKPVEDSVVELETEENVANCSWLSEGSFNVSRIIVASTPLPVSKFLKGNSDIEKLDCLKNIDENIVNTTLKRNASEVAVGNASKAKKRKSVENRKKSTECIVADIILEESSSSCVEINAPNLEERVGPSEVEEKKCLPIVEQTRQVSDDIKIIDRDTTNNIVKNRNVGQDVQFLSYKKSALSNLMEIASRKTRNSPINPIAFVDLSSASPVRKKVKSPKKPITFVDLSGSLEGSNQDDSVIVLDEVEPCTSRGNKNLAPKFQDFKNKLSPKGQTRKQASRKSLLAIKPTCSMKQKKKNKKKKKKNKMPIDLIQEDVAFLGTGISKRLPNAVTRNSVPTAPTPPDLSAVGNLPPIPQPNSSAGANLPPISQPESSAIFNWRPFSQPESSVFGTNFENPNGKLPQAGLRPIVIDGSNVAMGHGNHGQYFSSRGIEICVNYFLKRGHKVYCFIPLFRMSDSLTRDRHLLVALEKQGHLICTPSRYVGSSTITPYDDRYIVQIAAELGGIIISRDNYRDLIQENPAFRETILTRTLMYTWVGDILMFPTDPFGRMKMSLEQMLRF